MGRRIASLEATLGTLRSRAGREQHDRIVQEDSRSIQDLLAQEETECMLREGFNALDLMLAKGAQGDGAFRTSLAGGCAAVGNACSLAAQGPVRLVKGEDAALDRLDGELVKLKQEMRPELSRMAACAVASTTEEARPVQLEYATLADACAAGRDWLTEAVSQSYSFAAKSGEYLGDLARGFAAKQEAALVAVAAPVVSENDRSAALMERRIARLTTELEAVKAAQPDWRQESQPLFASYSEEGAVELAALPPSDQPLTPPGTRTARQRSNETDAWHSIIETPAPSAFDAASPARGEFHIAAAPGVEEVMGQDVSKTYVPQSVDEEVVPQPVARPVFAGDPLERRVDIDFRDMDLSHVVGLLAETAQINVVAGTKVSGMVTARLKNVTLRQAMETVLRLNGLGIIQERDIYRILPYEEVLAAQQVRRVVYLEHTKADEIKATLQDISLGMPEGSLISISTNATTNVIILAGPEEQLAELEGIIRELDVDEPVLPTVTEAIKLNYADPDELMQTLQSGALSKDIGFMAADSRGRHLIVTDVPVRVEQIRSLVEELDKPVRQVSIDAMIVDAILTDSAETGVDWFFNALRRVNQRGETVGNLQELRLDTSIPLTSAGQLTFDILSSEINVRGLVSAEVRDNKARLLANPMIVTIENKPATINISQEVPYQEQTQSLTGPPMTSTGFKDIGTVLEVTPRVTHDEHILVEVSAKQSSQGEMSAAGVPTEIKRMADTSLRTKNGQTIFIGGLRGITDNKDVTKVPVLGDIPVVNFLFRQSSIRKESTELLIFLTCNVLQDEIPDLTPEQQARYNELGETPTITNSQKELFRDFLHPNEVRDPVWRRSR